MIRPLRIAASLLAADFSHLAAEVSAVDKAGADWLHLDVMDGCFVPNISFGAGVVGALRGHSERCFDVHLMVRDPDAYIDAFKASGADIITVHAEACQHLDRSLAAISEAGVKAGVAINPATSLEAVRHVLDRVSLVLVMSVNPGFGGQRFIAGVLPKISELRSLIGGRAIDIEVDGGIDVETAALAVDAGANVLVAGSAIFGGGSDYAERIAALRQVAQSSEGTR